MREFPPVLKAAVARLDEGERGALMGHLQGNTSADWIADLLTRHASPVSASTIRQWRAGNRRDQSRG